MRQLSASGAERAQMNEPCLVLDLDVATHAAQWEAYGFFAHALPKLILTSYSGRLGDNLDTVLALPVAGISNWCGHRINWHRCWRPRGRASCCRSAS
nr:hypothetical protein [Ancylobacter sp. Lp-2]